MPLSLRQAMTEVLCDIASAVVLWKSTNTRDVGPISSFFVDSIMKNFGEMVIIIKRFFNTISSCVIMKEWFCVPARG